MLVLIFAHINLRDNVTSVFRCPKFLSSLPDSDIFLYLQLSNHFKTSIVSTDFIATYKIEAPCKLIRYFFAYYTLAFLVNRSTSLRQFLFDPSGISVKFLQFQILANRLLSTSIVSTILHITL